MKLKNLLAIIGSLFVFQISAAFAQTNCPLVKDYAGSNFWVTTAETEGNPSFPAPGTRRDWDAQAKTMWFLRQGEASDYNRAISDPSLGQKMYLYRIRIPGYTLTASDYHFKDLMNVFLCHQRAGWPLSKTTNITASKRESVSSSPASASITLSKEEIEREEKFKKDHADFTAKNNRVKEGLAAFVQWNRDCSSAPSNIAECDALRSKAAQGGFQVSSEKSTPAAPQQLTQTPTSDRCAKEVGAIFECKAVPRMSEINAGVQLDGNQVNCTNTYSYSWEVELCNKSGCQWATVSARKNNERIATFPGEEYKTSVSRYRCK